MELRRLMSINAQISFVVLLITASAASANIATLEDINLPDESYWNGSDGSGDFISDGIFFNNNYNTDWDSWDGFSLSNITDCSITDLPNQYCTVTGTGQGGTSNYAICYIGFTIPPTITLSSEGITYGLYVTNCKNVYDSMLNGDMFSKIFGGSSGNDPDWFKLTITGIDIDGYKTGEVEFYLADYRFDNNEADYIVDTWEFVDLTTLGNVKTLQFNLNSSDTGDFGMNTSAYFALDTILCQSQVSVAGPYNESGINGYIDPLKNGQHASPQDSLAIINPIFKGWATEVVDYYQTPGVDFRWRDPNKVLGPATGDAGDIFSLGDLSREQINNMETPGWITLAFSESVSNVKGYDFAVFENALLSETTTSTGSVAGEILAELAFVEVSSNGVDFVRFPSVSLTDKPGDLFSTIQTSNIHNLAGKHPNAYNTCTGTPFDLQEIASHPDVASGLVDLNDINFIRLVDIPGTGDFYDEAVELIDPNTKPNWASYSNNHPIFDAWNTSLVPLYPSGGFDLEAVGILEEQQFSADIDLNGVVDIFDFNIFLSSWHSSFGEPGWISRCDLAEPKNMFIDAYDFDVFASQWLQEEIWNNQ